MLPQDLAPSGLAFVEEIDRLKDILRQSLVHRGTRQENSAEHSWHLALSVAVWAPLANEPIDLARALKMALVHDVVEIDAGDTFIYDETASLDKAVREEAAAQRLFGLLPLATGTELRQLWEAYELQKCPESRFVGAIDRLLPLIANFKTEGHAWKKHGIRKSQVMARNQKIALGSKALWAYAEALINEGLRRGYLIDG